MPRLGWRWILAISRIAAMLAWFALIILPHLVLTLLGRRHIVPPRFLAGIGRIAGLRVHAHGRPAPGRLLIIANHLSWLDILALAGDARAVFVAHSGLAGFRFLKWLCEQNETVFIARERRGTVNAQVGEIEAALARRRVVVFPEGTTSGGRAMHPFKSALLSAAEANGARVDRLAVQPVALDYADAIEIAWEGAEPGMRNVMRVLARTRPVELTIRYLAPLEGADRRDRKAMASAAQAMIVHALRL